MSLYDEVRLIPYGSKLIGGKTDIDIDDAVALRAGEMVVVLASSTHTVMMRPVRKLDAGEQSHIYQLFDRAVYRGSPDARLGLSQLLPEAFNGEIRATAREFDQSIRNEFTGTRVTLAHLVESRVNFMCFHQSFLMRFRLSSY